MTTYNFKDLETHWQQYWHENQTYKVKIDPTKPKYYVLDMFPYPSGAGLHVGHPLGYIATDIVSRFKRMKGYNVLHPMGFDSFGLPAEQHAIATGEHPNTNTTQNINNFVKQLKRLGFDYDWTLEIRTSEPEFYKWTQWIFGLIFNAWYDKTLDKARPINELIALFETEGNANVLAVCNEETPIFSAMDWKNATQEEQHKITLNYRLAYLAQTNVNWCPELKAVLANDEIKDGLSERGGHPIEKRKMTQWSMRITAYADRLLEGLNRIDWTESLKEQQRNWIGKSKGATVLFKLDNANLQDTHIEVFTTRVDTLFGVSFLVLAPEHELVKQITTNAQKNEVEQYVQWVAARSDIERMQDKNVSGQFTGAYAVHPFTQTKIPLFIADYVLAGYGTGAVMAVPSGDQRDYLFAKKFDLPILNILDSQITNTQADPTKIGKYINSSFIDGLEFEQANDLIIKQLENQKKGKTKINYRLRDAIYSRQRYWGEPFPIYFKNQQPHLIPNQSLPILLPNIDQYLPTDAGEPPLARANNFQYTEPQTSKQYPIDTNTMPGWAGSSWYWFRYMDSQNTHEFASKTAMNYWGNVDFYLGGTEHAVGHLLYSRFWTKILFDLGIVPIDEPFQKLVNQGMILGQSMFVYRIEDSNTFVSYGLKNNHKTTALHVDVALVNANHELDTQAFKTWRKDYANAQFITENDKYICGMEVEKMSKSKYNVVSPDAICEQYGADTLRLYEMFLGPLLDAKPWDTKGIEGISRFLRKVWRLFYDDAGKFLVNELTPTDAELKILHKTIKKIEDDIERISFNTAVSAYMVCINELSTLKCSKRSVLEHFLKILAPFAPHIAEHLWQQALGNGSSIVLEAFPVFDEQYLKESTFAYPISINGKVRRNVELPLGLSRADLEQEVIQNAEINAMLEGKTVKKLIVVPDRIINFVV